MNIQINFIGQVIEMYLDIEYEISEKYLIVYTNISESRVKAIPIPLAKIKEFILIK